MSTIGYIIRAVRSWIFRGLVDNVVGRRLSSLALLYNPDLVRYHRITMHHTGRSPSDEGKHKVHFSLLGDESKGPEEKRLVRKLGTLSFPSAHHTHVFDE